MGVVVDQARQNEGPVQLDHPRPRPAVARRVAPRADRDDPPVPHRHGLRSRHLGLDRVEHAALQDQIGRRLRRRSRTPDADGDRRGGDGHQRE